MKEKLLVIGNGMSALRTIEELLIHTDKKYEISIFGEEPHVNYNRIMLSYLLSREKTFGDTILNTPQWYEDNNITLYTGHKISQINRDKKVILNSKSEEYEYDKLLIATGSIPFIPTTFGSDLNNVLGFRTKEDVDNILNTISNEKKAVVVGGGLLGLEAAYGIAKHGVKTLLIHRSANIMSQQLDSTAGKLLQKKLESLGIEFRLNTTIDKIHGDASVESVTLSDGETVDANIVVFSTGISPNKSIASDCGLETNKAILVNDYLQTEDENIFAIGECCEHDGKTFGLVAPLFEQAKICAKKLADVDTDGYVGSISSTRLKISGVDLFSAGQYICDENSEELILLDEKVGIYKKLVIKGNLLIGVILYGDTLDASWYLKLLKEETDISDLRVKLLFGKASLGDTGHGEDSIESMSDDEEVCGCNGITKGDIIEGIKCNNLKTLGEVKACTKAGASCGSCLALVEQVLVSTLGDEYQDVTPEGICDCCTSTHKEIKDNIENNDYENVYEVFKNLKWKKEEGCRLCRPAVNYYLLVKYNDDKYKNDLRSRLVNDRVHANIQKDGTYSVVPRIWGGVTNAKDLRAIADVADKYNVPTLKFTGGQRLDMLGIKKEDLAPMWTDLNNAGFVSGQAYAKGLRTVKTCVGNTWCRFGTQDAMQMGIDIEKMTWGSWTPHKFKIAVSGCPRNCAEATIKDIGVIAVDSGWEIHFAGNGGLKVRVTDFLTKVSSDEELFHYIKALMQFYREDAYYLERTAHWVERVGIDYVKDVIVKDDKKRDFYAKGFDESQKHAQIDPWKQSVDSGFAQEFEPIVLERMA